MPRSLALGAAAGVFVAVLPIPGVQLIAAAGLAWLVRGHRGAAALATFAANPVTYPLIWIASYTVGATILGTPLSDAARDLDSIGGLMAQTWTGPEAHTPTLISSVRAVWPALATLTIGALPLAVLAALAAYAGTRRFLRRADAPQRGVAHAPPRPGAAPRGVGLRLIAARWLARHAAGACAAVSALTWRVLSGTPHEDLSPPHALPYWGIEGDA